MLDVLTSVYKTRAWPRTWTQTLVITFRKKGNLHLRHNYRTISFISHPSNVIFKSIWIHFTRRGGETAVKVPRTGKSAGEDNIPAELVQYRCPDLNLQQDLEDRRTADNMDHRFSMTHMMLALIWYFLTVAHKALCQTLSQRPS